MRFLDSSCNCHLRGSQVPVSCVTKTGAVVVSASYHIMSLNMVRYILFLLFIRLTHLVSKLRMLCVL